MSMSDPIADMLARIRNAQAVNKPAATFPNSGVKRAILAVLQDEGYIRGFAESENKRELTVEIKYYAGRPVIEMLRRASRPGLRRYARTDALRPVRQGLGIAVVSTSKGVMTDHRAREMGVGGEVVCYVA
jgi:small subunit ribosomal protein S8